MKNKKKLFLIGGISLLVVACIVLTVVFTSGHSKTTKPAIKDDSDVSSGLVVDKPQENKENADIQALIDSNEKITDDGTGLKAQVEEEPEYKSSVKSTGNKATKPAEKTPIPAEQGQSGIVIGSGENTESYNCNTKNHHCDGPETHAFIQNLELEGCPYCGSHSCPSFYATDKWGHTCYTPSKCPKYNTHNDAAEYCQKCGKKCGDGGNGTCVQYITACNCPICGKWVESWTCHSH